MQADPEADAEAWQAHCRNVVAIVEGTVVDETEGIAQEATVVGEPDHAADELDEKQRATEHAEFVRGVRLRIFGVIVINLALWCAVAGVENAVARALLGCLGSMVAIASGCFYLAWQTQIRERAPPPPPPPVPEP